MAGLSTFQCPLREDPTAARNIGAARRMLDCEVCDVEGCDRPAPRGTQLDVIDALAKLAKSEPVFRTSEVLATMIRPYLAHIEKARDAGHSWNSIAKTLVANGVRVSGEQLPRTYRRLKDDDKRTDSGT